VTFHRALALVSVLLAAAPAAAQAPDDMSLRPFVMINQEQFAAKQTFDAVFESSSQTIFGGGLNVVQENYYLELSASRFAKTGERAFLDNGEAFRLGIPLKVTWVPLELTVGYRFVPKRRPPPRSTGPARPGPAPVPRVIPYIGGGVGLYRYTETSSFSGPGEDLDTRHVGGILEGGVEFRVHRWIALAGGVHYTRIPGIFGEAGISKDANETDLGGIAARFKVLVGR
jgi:opacity protein-like surface antigen